MAMDRSSQALLVEGHRVSDEELEIFWTVMEVGTWGGAAKKLGYSRDKVARVMKMPWTERLYDSHVKVKNQSFMSRMQEHDDDLLNAYGEIIRGERAMDKSAMAVVKAAEMRLRAGKNPILDTRSISTTINNEQHNTAIVLTPEQLKEMTPEELIELNRNGAVPERFKQSALPEWNPPQELPVTWVSPESLRNRVEMERKKLAEQAALAETEAGGPKE